MSASMPSVDAQEEHHDGTGLRDRRSLEGFAGSDRAGHRGERGSRGCRAVCGACGAMRDGAGRQAGSAQRLNAAVTRGGDLRDVWRQTQASRVTHYASTGT
ncbi:hypothetical protein Bcep18194_B2565 [Burkholderia lata]|uniref:Uncharacterized protein n=1 Tax=Burkholderia lata (strain ATCC 17760 / DSM 23089 / LMG 22485 / NCIMB 9086 / R18194 / 383) TaxID=482957 RepID=Q392E0_BURL3|nr:hypothetical protein Bcep18194_B2565 [Burkholderia lata]